jgi:ribosomal-protein-alanine N-acetyltransferase
MVTGSYPRPVPDGGIVLTRMRWWHVRPVLALEQELFAEEPWSEAAFWSELAETSTRHYVVALEQAHPAAGAPGTSSGPVAGDGPVDVAVLGYAGLAVFDDEAHVLTIGVTRSAQGRGIGGALLRDLLAAAGQRRVFLDVRVDNAVAQRLYTRHGFVRVGRRRRYYQPSGTDAVVMAREPD